MRVKYETAFRIHDHFAPDDPEVPWPLLAISPRESPNMMDPLDFRLDQFAENKVHELFGISFLEFIALPRYDLLKILDSAKKHSARLLNSGDTGFKKLEKLFQQSKKT